ncbi:leucine-rich repeat flightless-interacting protein 1 isoform X5 [Ambystoma mexicanum]|uniref:leucine-rich repeat flightless-interacting protein 1 isoform X5 n=1 Tax=Ambystoma mexicanum TaxID=8296 RepID=UPI0037E9763A
MEAPGPGGRKRLPQRLLGAEDEALNQIAREAEARLAAKRAARAEAREIRMKELERQQKEIYQVQKKYYGLDTKWGDIEQWMEDSERYSHKARRNTSVSDEDERMSVGSRGSLRGTYHSDLGLPSSGANSKSQPAAQNGSRPSMLSYDALPSRSYRAPIYDDSFYSGSRRYSASSSRGPSEYSCYLGSGSRASSRTSSARASPVVEERPDKDFNDKGARTASSLSAATLASLGGTSSRRGSGDTSISVDTEASIREIKDISELKDQIQDVEGRYMQGLKEMKDSLAEVEEKYKKAMVSNAQLDNEKTNFMYQVETLKDVLLELEEQLAETHRQYEDKNKEFEREKHSHRILQTQYNELKESLQQKEEMLTEIRQLQQKQETNSREISDLQETIEWKDKKIGALERQKEFFDCVRSERDELRDEVAVLKEELKRHGIVLSSDLSPNGGLLDGPPHGTLVDSFTKGTGETASDMKTTGDGPLGQASQMKMKGDRVQDEHSLQSLETVEPAEKAVVKDTEKTPVKRTLHTDGKVETEGAGGNANGLMSLCANGHKEHLSTIGEQAAKRDVIVNEGIFDGLTKGFHLDSVTTEDKYSHCESVGLNVAHMESQDTLQIQSEPEMKGVMGHLQVKENQDVTAGKERESCSEDFHDAVEFVVGQKIACPLEKGKEESDIQDKPPIDTDETSHVRATIESQDNGYQMQGILQDLGKHLDGFFDAVSENLEGGSRVRSENTEAMPQNSIGREPEAGEVAAQEMNINGNRLPPNESIVKAPEEVAEMEEEKHEGCKTQSVLNKDLIDTLVDTSIGIDVGIKGDAGSAIPLGGEQRLEADITQAEICTTQQRSDARVYDAESLGSKPHSDDGEFYECSNEGGSMNIAAPDAHLGEELVNSNQNLSTHHHGGSRASDHSSPTKVEELCTMDSENVEEKLGEPSDIENNSVMVREEPVLPSDRGKSVVEICTVPQKTDSGSANVSQQVERVDMTVEEQNQTLQGIGSKGALENQQSKGDTEQMKSESLGPDSEEASLDKRLCDLELEKDSFEFDDTDGQMPEDGANLALGFARRSGKEGDTDVSTQLSARETSEHPVEVHELQNKAVPGEVKDEHHDQSRSLEAIEQGTEVTAHPVSAENSSCMLPGHIEQSSEIPDLESSSVDPFEPPDLGNSQAYCKEDTLDRGIKRGKGKNKEDCLLS